MSYHSRTLLAYAYRDLPVYSSKDARANLPKLLDEVVDSGTPALISKLGTPRVALIPARNIWIDEMADLIGLKGVPMPATEKEGMEILMRATERYLKQRSLEPQP
jgi:prevent-host-death family protein